METKFLDALKSKDLVPLWTQMNKMVPPSPSPNAIPTCWKYATIRPHLIEAGDIIESEEAERRVLMLVNPALSAPYTTDTIYGGLQIILPNEVAPAHRHLAFAMRFIIEGSGGFTAVEGEKMFMERGDVILTPSWHWHDHGNEGTEPVIWLDGLNLPLFQHARVNFAETYTESRYPSTYSKDCRWRFPWKDVVAAFAARSGTHRIFHYEDTGQPLSTTLGAQAEMIEAGYETTFHQESSAFIYHCYEGNGETFILTPSGKESLFQWEQGDTFAVPAWSKVRHKNKHESRAAYLFAINDRPLLKNLGLFREAGE